MFSQLLVADSVRGTHGTGIIKVYADGKHDWRKIAGDPYSLFSADGISAFYNNFDKKEVRFLLGHNRFATRGDKDTDCAHPFEIGDITLMHNGTLEGWNKIVDFDKFKVDSEAICNSIDKEGIEKTIEAIRGAYVLVYYNSKEKTVNFIRNKERPLFLGVQLELGRVYFASEYSMLRWILLRNNISTAKIEELPVHQLFSFSLHDMVPKMVDMKKQAFDSYTFRNQYGQWNTKTQQFEPLSPPLGPDDFKSKKQKKRENKKPTALTVVDPTQPGTKFSGTFLDSSKEVYTSVDQVYGYKLGDTIRFKMMDYQPINLELGDYRIEGFVESYPELEIWAYIKGGNAVLDPLINSLYIKGIIVNLKRSLENTHRPKNRIWVRDVEIVPENEEKKVLKLKGKEDIEEAEVVSELTREQQYLADMYGADSIWFN